MGKRSEQMTISKEPWLQSLECLAQAWWTLRLPQVPPTEAQRFRMEQGIDVHQRAQQLFSSGLLVPADSSQSPSQATSQCLADEATTVLFEATFAANSLIARADILRRTTKGWWILEVKSSFPDSKKFAQYVDDVAYTVMVARMAGMEVAGASLLLLSRDYRFGDTNEQLFEEIDVTTDVDSIVEGMRDKAGLVIEQLVAEEVPSARLLPACKDCNHFSAECLGRGVDHSIFELPRLHKSKVESLADMNIVRLCDVPSDFALTAPQQRVLEAVSFDRPFVDTGLADALTEFDWPCHYLDFETVATDLPLYPGKGCHEQVLTQFSVHHCNALGRFSSHDEYLADASVDCERTLAEALLTSLGDVGSIVVYSSFERTRICSLASRFEDVSSLLHALLKRFVDLHALIQKRVYHPAFRGSTSIKTVLPVLVPDVSYADLEISDGDTAISRFARMARGEVPTSRVEFERTALLAYCKRDTEAMVRLHVALHALCVKS